MPYTVWSSTVKHSFKTVDLVWDEIYQCLICITLPIWVHLDPPRTSCMMVKHSPRSLPQFCQEPSGSLKALEWQANEMLSLLQSSSLFFLDKKCLWHGCFHEQCSASESHLAFGAFVGKNPISQVRHLLQLERSRDVGQQTRHSLSVLG